MRAQALQFSIPELDRIAFVRFDMIRDARGNDFAFRQAHGAQRLALKLTARRCHSALSCSRPPIGLVLDVDQYLDGMLD
jgi:hypothetical protein